MGKLKKILCPVDLTSEAAPAAHEAASLAQKVGAELLLIHVMNEPAFAMTDPMLGPGEMTGYALPALAEEYRDEMNKRLHRLGAKLETPGLTVTTRLIRGSVHESIVDAAEQEHADMIVMATHGRTGIQHFILGSVAERVVRTAKVPVMTLRLA